jgi:PKD repeat protein
MIKQLTLSMLSIFLTVQSYGQVSQRESLGKLLLTNHKVDLQQIPAQKPKDLPTFDGYAYLIIQGINHVEKPKGLTYLNYLPKNAGLYQVEEAQLESVLDFVQNEQAFYHSLSPQWKLSVRIFEDNIPDWAWLDKDHIKVWVEVYPSVNLVKARTALRLAGEQLLETDAEHRLFALSVSAARAKSLANYPFVMHVQEMEDPGTPENWTARTSHRVNYLQSEIPNSDYYDGSGVTLSLGDDGAIGPHIDYAGRLDQSAAGNSNGDHGDHVAGTIFGAGNMDPQGRGMAPGLDMIYYSYPANLTNADSDHTNNGVTITSSSYSNGCNAGYTNFTVQMDQDYAQHPELVHVFSAGNSGTNNCGYGAGAGWGNVTGGHKIAKNVIAVANLTRLDAIAGSSSRGPASDGRIKPDVGAVGSSVFSTTDVNQYTLKTGTSMSCPGTSGTIAVLNQAYKATHTGTNPNSALIKAILMNSAEDLGNPGPDFSYGYGRINARRALEAIENDQFFTGSLSSTGTGQHTINVPNGVSQAKIMLYWGDVPSTTVSSRALVNDLDMNVVNGGTTLLPWVLDPSPSSAAISSNAVRARDSLNNAEQVTINNPSAGDVTVNVSAFNIPQGTQDYFIVYTFISDQVILTHPVGGEQFVPSTTEIIRWDAPEGTGTFNLEYSTDDGSTWQTMASSVNSNLRYYNWNVPNTVTGEAKVRVTRGNTSTTPGQFSIIGVPSNIRFISACPDTLSLSWDVVPQAAGYVVYRLGAKYMDSIGYTISNVFKAPNVPLIGEEYFAVSAVTNNGGIGLRSNAQERPTGLFNCSIDKDLGITQLLSPPNGNISDCFNLNSIPVKAQLTNNGVDSLFGFTVGYIFDGGSTISTVFNDTLASGDDFEFTSTATYAISPTTAVTKIWVTANGDRNPYNDTVTAATRSYSGQTGSYPFSDDLELSVPQCNTNSNCGATSCALGNGWHNYNGLSIDDSDWRGNSGGTPSNNTGPSTDQNPGTASGRYLYIEASDCFNREAWVQTPCIDLTTAVNPLFSFYYHMDGFSMGTLTLDVYDGEKWTNDVFTLSGSQGSAWNKGEVNMIDFVGKTVMIRFRGLTGSDYASDISIDNINLSENSAAPAANFTADAAITCINGTVNFTDASTNFPTSWTWSVSPSATASFIQNNSTSANVSINFTATGTYNVTLVATNAAGTDTFTQTSAVTVSAGATLSTFEDFENNGIPTDWAVINPDGFTAWGSSNVTGSNGLPTTAAVFNHFLNPSNGSRDDMVGINIDLTTQTNPLLFFDLAYATDLQGSNDSLLIMISTDCGATFTRTAYAKSGNTLATANASNTLFTPASAGDWTSDSLDLSPYVGQNVKVNFVAKSAMGNAVYLDNIQLVNRNVQIPTVSISTSNVDFCVNDTVTFNVSNSGGAVNTYNWDFGSAAIPTTATGLGPHKVIYFNNIPQTAEVEGVNDGGRSFSQISFNVERDPIALFGFTQNNLQVDFSDLSINRPTSWTWDFGDGNSSTQQNPIHTYTATGTFQVTHTATNNCGTATRTQTVLVTNVGLDEATGIKAMSLFPNPGKGNFTLSIDLSAGNQTSISVTDLSGKLILSEERQLKSGENQVVLDLTCVAQGIYMVKVKTESGERSLRAFKQ